MMPYENFENVKAEVRDGILYVTIDRPKVLNALNGHTVEEIYKVFAEGRDEPAQRPPCAKIDPAQTQYPYPAFRPSRDGSSRNESRRHPPGT